MPLTSDEPTRALVSLEMLLSGNYITPTIAGEFYYNKPPLYNWILAMFIHYSDGIPEFAVRMPAVLSLLGFAASVFLFTRRYWGKTEGILAALMLVTCGRILFWDSMLGLIDLLYSWVTFASFAIIINNLLKNNFLRLFVGSWILAAVGFMLKGIPSFLFQGISLFVLMLYARQWKRLFSWHHLTGIATFILLVGTYAMLYSRENSFSQYVQVLWDQSAQRASSGKGPMGYISHLLLFHPRMLYHFLPWSLLPVALFLPAIRKPMLKHFTKSTSDPNNDSSQNDPRDRVASMLLLLFIANISVYWLSPATIPRYILMLAPPAFVAGLHGVTKYAGIKASTRFRGIAGWMITGLLAARILVNVLWIPPRAEMLAENRQKKDALEMAAITGNRPVRVVGSSWIDHVTLVYLTRAKGEIIRREKASFESGVYYLADQQRYNSLLKTSAEKPDIIKTTLIRHQQETAYLIMFKPSPP
ncbi:MAG TPA: glycosyltransferase family 39 protein [Bacteroidales bacterium]|nr:glycosyltransferase family 39 protein [Bacteroidales bacterium]